MESVRERGRVLLAPLQLPWKKKERREASGLARPLGFSSITLPLRYIRLPVACLGVSASDRETSIVYPSSSSRPCSKDKMPLRLHGT